MKLYREYDPKWAGTRFILAVPEYLVHVEDQPGQKWAVKNIPGMKILCFVGDEHMQHMEPGDVLNWVLKNFKAEIVKRDDLNPSQRQNLIDWMTNHVTAKFEAEKSGVKKIVVGEFHEVTLEPAPTSFGVLSQKLPGMHVYIPVDRQPEPCFHPSWQRPSTLRDTIMHFNDQHKMSRERLADWLDKLHDDGVVDLEFKLQEEEAHV